MASPCRETGRCWGNQSKTLVIQGLVFQFRGLSAAQAEAIEERFRGFLIPESPDGAPHFSLQVWCRNGDIALPIGEFANQREEYEPKVFNRPDGMLVQGYNFRFEGILDHSSLRADVCTAEAILPRVDVFDNVLRISAAYAALASSGLLMHSAGVVLEGNAWLFLGRSNAGKSTLARAALASGRPILSDDINLLRPDGVGGYVAGAVPLTGDLRVEQIAAPNARFPVRGLLWLEQADRLRVSPVSPASATARLLACAPVVNMDPYRRDTLLAIVERFLTALPMRVLEFRRDEPFDAVADLLLEATD